MFADRTKWNLTPNRLSEALARHHAAGKPVLDLTVSNPTECGFVFEEKKILNALANPGALHYSPDTRGLESARRAVAGYYSQKRIEISVERIFLTTSTSEAYTFVLRLLCNPGDEILVPAPSYPLLPYLANIQDVNIIRYSLLYDHGWQIDFHALEQAISSRTRAVVVVHPNNPTGHYVKPAEIARLNGICSSRQIALIADEVFLDFSLLENRRGSFAAHSSGLPTAGALTFTLSGLSKISGLPQMKISWLIVSGPEQLESQALARLEVIADTFLSPSAPAQLAVPAFLELRHMFQKQLMSRVKNNLGELDLQLAGQETCSRLEIEGGWYAVLRVPATRSDEDLAIELLQSKNVYVHPGHFYDFPCDGYLVISLIAPERIFADGVRQLLSIF